MDLQKLQRLTEEFLQYFSKKNNLKQEEMPTVNFVMDESYVDDPFGMTGYYSPHKSEIFVIVPGRHYKDIMRTVSHECVHHLQNLRGDLEDMGDMGEGYAQKNEKMRNMEKEAFLDGNMTYRDWTDTRKEAINESSQSDLGSGKRSADLYERLVRRWVKKS